MADAPDTLAIVVDVDSSLATSTVFGDGDDYDDDGQGPVDASLH
jgi:hypothetical protein